MLSLGARFRTWKVMKGKYMSDTHQSNLIHSWVVKRGKKDLYVIDLWVIFFFHSSLHFLEPTSEDIYSGGGFSSLKDHSWPLQCLCVWKLTADMIQVPAEAVWTVTSSGLWISPFGSLQHAPGFFQQRQTCAVVQIQAFWKFMASRSLSACFKGLRRFSTG